MNSVVKVWEHVSPSPDANFELGHCHNEPKEPKEPSFDVGHVQVTKLCLGKIFERESRLAKPGIANRALFAFLRVLL